jgi:RNA polymerase sigma factor (sigma-70 family)
MWKHSDFRSGYTSAFHAGYRRTFLALLRRCHRYELAEDIAQAAWLRAFERWEQCRSSDAVSWVIGIARHMLIDEIRRSSRFCAFEPEHDRPSAMAVDPSAIDAERILNKSSRRQCQLLRTVYIEERSTAAIARELGISNAAVHARVSRALQSARKLVTPK